MPERVPAAAGKEFTEVRKHTWAARPGVGAWRGSLNQIRCPFTLLDTPSRKVGKCEQWLLR
jgi:hypothetical protein